ncbi:MAG: hypothetical protein U0992_21255 [Planctomycetaceae bacterium]
MFVCRDFHACALALLLFAGCGNSNGDASADRIKSMAGGDLKTVVPVSGKVLVDGEPKAGVKVMLYVDGPIPQLHGECGTKPDGTYCWTTYGDCDGIVPGEYKVTFRQWRFEKENERYEASDDLLHGKYSDPRKSQFKLSVKAGAPQTNADYELTTAKK